CLHRLSPSTVCSSVCVCSSSHCSFFSFNDPATTEIYTLSLHDALPIYSKRRLVSRLPVCFSRFAGDEDPLSPFRANREMILQTRSEEHTSELQSRENLVCRLLLEKKKKIKNKQIEKIDQAVHARMQETR